MPVGIRRPRNRCASFASFGRHAAVLDVNMPGLDGFAILSAIRRDALRCGW
jgi:CheY-like chemotaxis protein